VKPSACGLGPVLPDFGIQVSGHPISGCRLNVSGMVVGFWLWVSGFRFRISGSGFRVPGFRFRIPGSGFRFSGVGSRVPGLRFRGSG